ncbi:unnamed protein product [Closterium sp. NIES-53]
MRTAHCSSCAALLLPALPCPHAALLAAAPPFAARAPPICSPHAAPCNMRAALLQPAAPPLAARTPPLAAHAPPVAPARCPAAARPAACSSAGQRSAARTALLRAALLLAPPGCCPPCCAQPFDSATCSQGLTRDAATRLAVRNHLPLAERTHFGQHKTAKALYVAVVAHYSSPATAALGRLILPYLFPELSSFAIVENLITHLRTSDARYCAALPAKFLDRNPPTMYIFLYFIVTRLLDTLRAVRDHFLALDPEEIYSTTVVS